jgi:protein-tyrosine-phosphatase/N-acetylglutamate synthase-like GNAT family acetyltransferase
MKNIVFACVHNAGRSQMAAALFNRWADPAKAHAISAGTAPGDWVHPEVVSVMKELGIDLSAARPQRLTDDLAGAADMLVTMGCGDACPVVPRAERDDWPLQDPKGKSIDEVRAIRGEIERRVRSLLAEKGWAATTGAGPVLGDSAVKRRDATARDITIEPAKAEDKATVRSLLLGAALPIEGLEVGFPAGYAVARRRGAAVGCAGLERYGNDALLRSVAVSADARGSGVGIALVRDRLSAAKAASLGAVYLLTTTAPEFFRALGFEPCDRNAVPVAVQGSAEFSSICPSSATCMRHLV